jgi:methyltransferase, FkbM family
MSDNPELDQLRARLWRLEREAAAHDYPSAERISYIARIGPHKAFFLTQDRYSHSWFYPRYANGQLHEPALTRILFDSLTPESVFVDVGAHLGYFSIVAAMKAKAVYAIEPQEFLIGRIHANAAANHMTNVTLVHAAAGDKPGFAQIPKVGSPVTKLGDSQNLVPMIRLDDYFTGPHQPTHLKIDTEGFEYHVLSGAASLLKARPMLFIEFHRGMEKFGPDGFALWDMLNDCGYHIAVGNHRRGTQSVVFAEVPRADINRYQGAMLVCRPR